MFAQPRVTINLRSASWRRAGLFTQLPQIPLRKHGWQERPPGTVHRGNVDVERALPVLRGTGKDVALVYVAGAD
jgi:hypothetical protein